jgi:Terminase RNaseH-like domain/Terminase large subunit, T4likevirus-type, N-terminal
VKCDFSTVQKAYQSRINQLKSKTNVQSDKLKIPDQWENFARLLQIQSGDRIVYYEPYDYQIELNNTFDKYTATMGVKSRQMGWTTYAASKGLHKATLNAAYTAIYISQTQSDASLIAYTVRLMLLSIPEYARAVNDNLMIQRIEGGGTLHFRSPGPNATRGIPSVSDIFIDEAAFIDNVELLYGQVKNTQSMVGDRARTLIISTPNTVTDWFYQKLTNNTPEITRTIDKVRKGEINPIQTIIDPVSGWAKLICHWRSHPIYSQDKDYLKTCAERDQIPLSQVYRERDLSFEDNVLNVFSSKLIEKVCSIPQFTKENNGESLYYMGIDTAGVGNDYFVAIILEQEDEHSYRLAEIYRQRTGTIQSHVFEISKLIKKYEPYKVAIETNSGGQNYLELLQSEFLSQSFLAVKTTQESKANMINKLLYMMENNNLRLVNHRNITDEFLSYQKQGNQYGAISGKHDDIVMATAICCSGIQLFSETIQ